MEEKEEQGQGSEGSEERGSEESRESKEGKQEVFDAEYVRKLREEAARHRTKAKAFEEELKKLKDAQLSEEERKAKEAEDLRAENAALKAKARRDETQAVVEKEARKLGFRDPEDASRFIVIGDDSTPESIRTDLEELVKQKPYLKRARTDEGDLSAGNPPREGSKARKETDSERRLRLFGGGSNFFDAEAQRRLGGGVLFNPELNPKQRIGVIEGEEGEK